MVEIAFVAIEIEVSIEFERPDRFIQFIETSLNGND